VPALSAGRVLSAGSAVAALGLLAGCSGSGPAASAASSAAATSATVPGTSSATSTTVAAVGSLTVATSSGAPGECSLQNVTATLASPRGDGSQRTVSVVWRNVSGKTCTMSGFGGVDLVGPADPNGTTYSLPRSGQRSSIVALAPGATAYTVITYLSPDPGSVGSNGSQNWTPTEAVVTPPNETHHKTLPWIGGPVERQDGATHPGTFIAPVSAG
jgi:hypothetical protein